MLSGSHARPAIAPVIPATKPVACAHHATCGSVVAASRSAVPLLTWSANHPSRNQIARIFRIHGSMKISRLCIPVRSSRASIVTPEASRRSRMACEFETGNSVTNDFTCWFS